MVLPVPNVDAAHRRDFLDGRRVAARAAFDRDAARYDAVWGGPSATHLDAVTELLRAARPGGEILDAACGTGRYWDVLEAAGHTFFAIDQSAEMLAIAHAKHPHIDYRELALQDLRAATDLHSRFDGLMCIDAMEWIGREDWPAVLDGFRRALRPGGWAYLAIEIPEDKDVEMMAGPVPAEQVRGEIVGDGGFYAYFPGADAIAEWSAEAGFVVRSELHGDGYRHLILQSATE